MKMRGYRIFMSEIVFIDSLPFDIAFVSCIKAFKSNFFHWVGDGGLPIGLSAASVATSG